MLEAAFDGAEDQAIDNVANRYDQDHDCDHLTHVIQIAAHHEQLPKPETDENHFAGDQ